MNSPSLISRRGFLTGSAAVTSLMLTKWTRAEDRPPVTNPRATSGDDAVEPDWKERIVVTVGPKAADIVGTNEKAIQAAVDYVARLGGGTVQILPGEFKLRNAIFLTAGTRLAGSGPETILKKEASISTTLAEDSDWYDQEITLTDASGFRLGDGVCLRTKNPHNGAMNVLKRTLVARSGNRFKLDKPLRENYWKMGQSTCSTLFPLVTSEYTKRLAIENLVLDGNRANNENLDGNYAGCIFLQDCSNVSIRGVTARDYNGDGVSWQICHDVTVENCHSLNNAGLGLHPGSGSQRPVIRKNKLEGNDIGIFFCWGVKFGIAEANTVIDNKSSGISIGHRDNNNLIVDNEIVRSGKVGVLFRPERGPDFAPHRNRLERNRIVDSGGSEGIAVDVQGATQQVVIAKNDMRETRGPAQRIGIRLGPDTREISLEENKIEGFQRDIARA